MRDDIEVTILEVALDKIYAALDSLIDACTDSQGFVCKPSPKNISIARAILPKGYKHAYTKGN